MWLVFIQLENAKTFAFDDPYDSKWSLYRKLWTSPLYKTNLFKRTIMFSISFDRISKILILIRQILYLFQSIRLLIRYFRTSLCCVRLNSQPKATSFISSMQLITSWADLCIESIYMYTLNFQFASKSHFRTWYFCNTQT